MAGQEANHCYCGDRSKIWTSWTDNNPGRRFYGCPNNKANGSCGYFNWLDPPICLRLKRIVPKLLRRIEGYRARERIYWVALVISWVITIGVVLIYLSKKKGLRNGGRVLFLS
ncbi:hypothetical protein L1049_021775 [Liquidambar formosana]|uniref:GRF-type domain-containing protein n=1 Tax=Liquidambar formosana TaxID=63359 RepID=A0AAP0WP82_LIQFO